MHQGYDCMIFVDYFPYIKFTLNLVFSFVVIFVVIN